MKYSTQFSLNGNGERGQMTKDYCVLVEDCCFVMIGTK